MGMASDLDAFADPGNIGVPGAKADVAGAQLGSGRRHDQFARSREMAKLLAMRISAKNARK
jgi:hypothetical protein